MDRRKQNRKSNKMTRKQNDKGNVAADPWSAKKVIWRQDDKGKSGKRTEDRG